MRRFCRTASAPSHSWGGAAEGLNVTAAENTATMPRTAREGKNRRRKKQRYGKGGASSSAAAGTSKQAGERSGKNASKPPADVEESESDDIVAQLQRQRRKARERAAASAAAADATEGTGASSSSANPPATGTGSKGGFQYDPVRKRYFPKAAFRPHGNNDACVQRIQKQLGAHRDGDSGRKRKSVLAHSPAFFVAGSGTVTDGDLQRVVFRGTSLPWRPWRCNDDVSISVEWRDNGDIDDEDFLELQRTGFVKFQRMRTEKKNRCNKPSEHVPCTEQTNLLLATSLEYCGNPTRRKAIASMLATRSVARRAKVVPTQSTLDAIRDDTEECMYQTVDLAVRSQRLDDAPTTPRPHRLNLVKDVPCFEDRKWFSLLHPLKRPLDTQQYHQPPWIPTMPFDCRCKEYLHPTTPTFDVLPGVISYFMPGIATISSDTIFYRSPFSMACERPAWEVPRSVFWPILQSFCRPHLNPHPRHSESAQIYGVQFWPLFGTAVGYLMYDPKDDERTFTLQLLVDNPSNIPLDNPSVKETFPLASPVNDFRFTPDTTRENQGVVAFAHGGEGSAGASFLDLSTESYFSIRDNWSQSEPLCVQLRKNTHNTQALFGHRDGSVSLIDTRSQDALFATSFSLPGVSFGSATSIQPYRESHSNNMVAVKGSFGPVRVFDIRCLSNSKDISSRYQQSTVLELSLPDSLVHQTKSARCTGLAMDPTDSIVITPFAGRHDDILFAFWDSHTGALLRTLNLGSVGTRACAGAGADNGLSAFCELSSVVTSGYEMLCSRDYDEPIISIEGGSWGLWFKTNVLSDESSLPEGGGIHHMRF